MTMWTCAALLVAALGGCAVTDQSPSIAAQQPEFLSDHSQLRQEKKDRSLLLYVNPDVDWTKYNSAILVPVEVWDSRNSDVSQHDQAILGSYYYVSLKRNFASNLRMVDRAGPGVLTIRVALTNPRAPSSEMRAISNTLADERIVSSVENLAPRSYMFVQSACSESEILDSVTGETLAAAVDRRAHSLNAEDAIDLWAQWLDQRLTEWRLGPET
jgi:hypothetical protein